MTVIDETMPLPGTPPRRTSQEDLEGFDESQRAEVVEALGGAQTGGDLATDIKRDTGDDPFNTPGDEFDAVVSSEDEADADEDLDEDEL